MPWDSISRKWVAGDPAAFAIGDLASITDRSANTLEEIAQLLRELLVETKALREDLRTSAHG